MASRKRRNSLAAAALLLACVCTPLGAQQAARNPNDLPPARLAPRLLDDRKEMRTYMSALPEGVYKVHQARSGDSFYLDDIRDAIKSVLREGYIWEEALLPYMRKYAKPGSTVIDAGAHIGVHTLTLARAAGPEGRVYAFEPQKKIYRELVYNLKLNGIQNVVPLRYALGDSPAVIRMGAAVPRNEGATQVGGEGEGDRAELRTIDEFGFRNVSFIKIDVEHYEDYVLNGARKTIAKQRPVLLVEIQGGESHDNPRPEIRAKVEATRKLLTDMGYRLERVSNHDYLALPQ